jgi:sugar-specific transcriptional regulator TrmB
MTINEELISKIKDFFDLNIYETKVWLALLERGIASASEIAYMSRVPRSRTYDVLESLEKKGFAIERLGKPIKFIGVKPHVILEKLKNNVKKDAEEKVKSLSELKDTVEYEKLEELYREGVVPVKREDITAALKGRSNISNYLKDLIQNAKKEVIICMNANDMLSKFKIFKNTIDILNKNGIKIQIALSGEDNVINDIAKRLKIKVKKMNIDTKFFIIDKEQMLFYLSLERDMAVWINSDFFVSAFSALFEKALEVKA